MPKNKPLPDSRPCSIEMAWESGNRVEFHRAIVRKCCRVLDMTESGRDIRPLIASLMESVACLDEAEKQWADDNVPLYQILKEAQSLDGDTTAA